MKIVVNYTLKTILIFYPGYVEKLGLMIYFTHASRKQIKHITYMY